MDLLVMWSCKNPNVLVPNAYSNQGISEPWIPQHLEWLALECEHLQPVPAFGPFNDI